MRSYLVPVVALLLLVAGCAAPVADPGTEDPSVDSGSATDGSDASSARSDGDDADGHADADHYDADGTADVPPPEQLAAEYEIEADDELPADTELIFARMQIVTNEPDARPPDRVQVFAEGRMTLGGGEVSRFRELVGITYPEGEELVAAGYVDGPDRIVMNEELLDDPQAFETVLAHEAVHVIQYEQEAFATTNEHIGESREFRSTVDAGLTYQAIIEGTAVHAETEYWKRYGGNGTVPNDRMTDAYYDTEGAMRLGFGPYRWGARHVADRVNDSTEFERVYETPPQTTSEVIHGVDDTTPPVAELELDGDDTGEWTVVDQSGDRKGELFVRVALASELSDDRAAAAGTGWRNDWQLAFSDETERSYVWALRFEDEANATAFESAAVDYMDARADRAWVAAPDGDGAIIVWRGDDPEASYRVVRVTDDTVVLLLGENRFVEETRIDGDDGAVSANSP